MNICDDSNSNRFSLEIINNFVCNERGKSRVFQFNWKGYNYCVLFELFPSEVVVIDYYNNSCRRFSAAKFLLANYSIN